MNVITKCFEKSVKQNTLCQIKKANMRVYSKGQVQENRPFENRKIF